MKGVGGWGFAHTGDKPLFRNDFHDQHCTQTSDQTLRLNH